MVSQIIAVGVSIVLSLGVQAEITIEFHSSDNRAILKDETLNIVSRSQSSDGVNFIELRNGSFVSALSGTGSGVSSEFGSVRIASRSSQTISSNLTSRKLIKYLRKSWFLLQSVNKEGGICGIFADVGMLRAVNKMLRGQSNVSIILDA